MKLKRNTAVSTRFLTAYELIPGYYLVHNREREWSVRFYHHSTKLLCPILLPPEALRADSLVGIVTATANVLDGFRERAPSAKIIPKLQQLLDVMKDAAASELTQLLETRLER